MRDILTHHYFATLKAEVESTVANDLEVLDMAAARLQTPESPEAWPDSPAEQ